MAAGAPVSTAIIGVENLEHSLHFYRDTLGLSVLEARDWAGPEFTRHWRLPDEESATVALLGAGPDPVGQLLLMQFKTATRRRIRTPEQRRAAGLFNLNFYTRDIAADYRRFTERGYEFWSEPAHNNFGAAVGESIEVVFEGPDGVPINLVQLVTENRTTMIGDIKQFVESYGRTPTGYTPVVTTSHGVISMDRAVRFYQTVLGMQIAMESVLDAPDTNQFLSLPEEARTRSVFMQGKHPFGKIALSEPINYQIGSLVDVANPPNIGYIAQTFVVENLDDAAQHCREREAEFFARPMELDLPGRGPGRAMIVRNPGSGALQQVVEAN